jgi:hypothetical protein
MPAVLVSFPDLVKCVELLSMCALCFLPLCGLLFYKSRCVYSDHSDAVQYKPTVLFCVTFVWYVNTRPDITPQETSNSGPSDPNVRRRLVTCLLCESTILRQALSRSRGTLAAFSVTCFYSRVRLCRAESTADYRGRRNLPHWAISFHFLSTTKPLSTRRRKTFVCLRNWSTPVLEILQLPLGTMTTNSAIPNTRSFSELLIMAFAVGATRTWTLVRGDNSIYPFHSLLVRIPPSHLRRKYGISIEDDSPYPVPHGSAGNDAAFAKRRGISLTVLCYSRGTLIWLGKQTDSCHRRVD